MDESQRIPLPPVATHMQQVVVQSGFTRYNFDQRKKQQAEQIEFRTAAARGAATIMVGLATTALDRLTECPCDYAATNKVHFTIPCLHVYRDRLEPLMCTEMATYGWKRVTIEWQTTADVPADRHPWPVVKDQPTLLNVATDAAGHMWMAIVTIDLRG